MQRAPKYVLFSLALVFCVGLLLKGSVIQVPTGTWVPSGQMTEARSGASTVLLDDGRILVTGGEGANGMLVSTELFDNRGSLSAAAPMDTPAAGTLP